MAYIDLVAVENAGSAADLLEDDRARRGYVPNYARAFAHRPDVYRAWHALVGAVAANMDERRYELATLAAARGIRSSYWSKTLDGPGVVPDAAYLGLPRSLRDALTVGRPIEAA